MIQNLHTKWFNEHLNEIESFIRNTLSNLTLNGTVLYSDGTNLIDDEGNSIDFSALKALLSTDIVSVVYNNTIALTLSANAESYVSFMGLGLDTNVQLIQLSMNAESEISVESSALVTASDVETMISDALQNAHFTTQSDVNNLIAGTFQFDSITGQLTIVTH